MNVQLVRTSTYRVKRGQTLCDVARAFCCPPSAVASLNALKEEPEEGRVLLIPPARDLYLVRGGESRTLLCGSEENFYARNGTSCLYPGQTVFL